MTTNVLPVLINAEGGAAKRAHDRLPTLLGKAFAKAGGDADIQLLAARDMHDAIKREAARHPRIVVAGGDGTISEAAQILAGAPTELALLPLGTLNHFAHALATPRNLEQAANLAVEGHARPIDVGTINGRHFINNVSIGLYPFMICDRDDIRERRGWPKWLATVPASWDALSRLKNSRLRLDLERDEAAVITPLLFVGNNHYSLERGSVGQRVSLSDGALSVFAVKHAGRTALLWFGLRALVGLVDRARDFAALGDTPTLVVRSAEKAVEVGIDGEIRRFSFPLAFSILPGGLRVVTPPPLQS